MTTVAFDRVSAARGKTSTVVVPQAPSRFTVGSSQWWIERLTWALQGRQQRFKILDEYYRGVEDLSSLAGEAWIESEVSSLFPAYLSANHAQLIVNASANRLVVLGFRTSVKADSAAARIWLRNEMDAESEKAHVESLVFGECPVLVEPNPKDATTPVITPQDPRQTIVWTAAGDRRIRLAALKTWWDDDVRRRFYILYLPDRIEQWQDREPGQMDHWLNRLFGQEPDSFEPRANETLNVKNPLGEIPILVIPNAPRLRGMPEAEHQSVLSRIDHYNKTLMDMAVTSHELAYPQRYASGIDEPASSPVVDTDSGDEIAPPAQQVRTGQTRWVTAADPNSKFGQFAAAELQNYVAELDIIRADIATESFTPYHYLLNMPTSVPPSGESITAAEAAFADKERGHQRDKGAAWRNVMRLAFLIAEDKPRAAAMAESGRTIWADPERRTESQHVDALGKMVTTLGLPKRAAWELLPATPEDMDRWERMLEEEQAAEPPLPVAPPAPPDAAAPTGPSASIQNV